MSDFSNARGGREIEGDASAFRFRSDLKAIYENRDDGTAEIRVVDPVNGKQFAFNEPEFFLCLAADGSSDYAAIGKAYRARFKREIKRDDLVSFYRRLRVLNLLEAAPAELPAPRRPARAGRAAGLAGNPDLDGFDDRVAFNERMPGGGRRGGFGGGGFGGGKAGGAGMERLLAALAARRMGDDHFGGMQGYGRAGGARKAPAASVHLFHPEALLRVLCVLFYPAKFALWLLAPALLIAGLAILHQWEAFSVDLSRIGSDYNVVTKMLLAAVTVNLASRLAQGMALIGAGAPVAGIGIKLAGGVIPRFYVDLSGMRDVDRRGALWVFGAPLLMRLGCFTGGVLVWALYRDSGTWLPDLALLIGEFGLAMFLIESLPLVPGDGFRWLAAYFNEPQLGAKAALVLKCRLSGRPLPSTIDRRWLGPLTMYAFAVVLTTAALLATLLALAAVALEQELGGTGVVIFLGLLGASCAWLLALRVFGPGPLARAGGATVVPQAAMAGIAGIAEEPDEVADPDQLSLMSSARVLWAVVAVALLGVAFLPYTYETGGEVEILPQDRSYAVALSDGEIVAVHVRQGDRVEPGQVLAEFSSWEEANQVQVTAAALEKAEAELDKLKAGATPEEIALAESKVSLAEADTAFAKAEMDRNAALVKTGTVPKRDYEHTVADYQIKMANLEVARAQLDVVQSGATEEELRIQEAEVKRLQQQLEFDRGELQRTRITAPTAGNVVTPDLDLMIGQYLDEGDALLQIEDTATITAAIAVPESDIALVETGDPVRLKLYGRSGEATGGIVKLVGAAAEQRDYGQIVRVEARFDNPDGLLRSGMTGYAKVEGIEMRVWEAFLRRIVRFFQIEVWSWVP